MIDWLWIARAVFGSLLIIFAWRYERKREYGKMAIMLAVLVATK